MSKVLYDEKLKNKEADIVSVYNSGREERYRVKYTAQGELRKKDAEYYNRLKSVPTIKSVKLEVL